MSDPVRPLSLWRRFGASTPRHAAILAASFVGAWLLLDIVFNLRFPGNERKFTYLLPSLDATVLLGGYALAAALGRKVPRAVTLSLVAAIVFVRLLRIADGVDQKYFHRDFNVYLDGRLLPDAVHLLRQTVPIVWLTLGSLAATLALGLVAFGVRWAIGCAEAFLEAPVRRHLFAGAVVAVIAAFPLAPSKYGIESYVGMFGSSVVPRLGHEVDFMVHLSAERDDRLARIHQAQTELAAIPSSLDLLGGAPVFLFVIESYGVTVFDPKLETAETREWVGDIEVRLREHGYSVASTRLCSPVYGGNSWRAQATIATGVQTYDELGYSLLQDYERTSLASFFRSAGYRTVLVQPGTIRGWPVRGVAGFDRRYASWDFDYQGPRFGWSLMPDQYALDFVHAREVANVQQPLFVEYALVSSHAPWMTVPTVVDDWSEIRNGEIFRAHPKVTFPTGWLGSPQIRQAYLSAIRYDLDVLTRYLDEVLTQRALVLVLGDHQPLPDVTGYSDDQDVPVHAISRDEKLLEPLSRRGYSRGWVSRRQSDSPYLATLLPTLLEAYSSPPVRGAAR